MRRVPLGRTGLEVGRACLGCGGRSRLGQARGASLSRSVAVVHAALDHGIDLIDTAEIYGTEPVVGAALEGRRDKVVLSTKLPVVVPGTPATGSSMLRAAELEARLEGSLRRLRTDHVDILHLHGVMPHQYAWCREELVPALQRLRDAGKIRFLGLTERFGADTGHAMLEEASLDPVWDVLMVGYNFVNQSAARAVLPQAREVGAGTMCMFAVRGPLAGRDSAMALLRELVARGELDAAVLDAPEPLGFMLNVPGVRTLSDAAYRFCAHTPGIDVVLTGTGNPAHLEQNVRAIDGPPLPSEVEERLRAMFQGIDSVSTD